ncbi:MAG: imidazolonepropionase [candidate division Zixibacteria bacterium]|nr:imidazolonepropionase [candidate division Zixibacteria bacterium]
MRKISATVIIKNAKQLVTLNNPQLIGPLGGEAMSELGIIKNGAIAFSDTRIAAVGTTRKIQNQIQISRQTRIIDARGQLVTPGLVDCHSHPVFAGSRANEFEMRLQGKSYMEIAQAGGGIKSTVKAVRKASPKKLFDNGYKVLDEMLGWGVTTVEGKSGYGLTLKDEIKMLKVLNKLNAQHKIDVIPTFLGAHDIPEEYKKKPDKYVGIICDEMIPAVAAGKLAKFCDVFCEKGVFTPKQTRAILQTAQAFGMKLKLHADQFYSTGGTELGTEFRATSVDHLDLISDEGIHLLRKTAVIPVLIPGCVFWLQMEEPAPARKMIDYGLPVAIGTDLNPGSSPIHSLPMAMSLACVELKMTPAETWCATTINSAHAVDCGDKIGSLSPGKKADVVIWDTDDYREIPYWFGKNLVQRVFKDGYEV